MHRLVLFAVLVGLAQASDKCPWMMGKYPFEEAKIAGEWNVIAMMPVKGDKVEKCAKLKFDANSIQYNGLTEDKSEVEIESVNTPYLDDPKYHSHTMAVWKKKGTDQWTAVYDQVVLTSDYKNYAVLVACKQTFDAETKKFKRHVLAEILSRTPKMGPETLDILKSLIAGIGVDETKLQLVDHSTCP